MTVPQAEVTVTIRRGRSEETHRFYIPETNLWTLAREYAPGVGGPGELVGFYMDAYSGIHSYSTETRTRLP